MKIDKHIEIVRSHSAGLSSLGYKSSAMICTLLQKHYRQVGITVINNVHDLRVLVAKRPDLVFLGMKYLPSSEDTETKLWIAEYLENNGINYTGSGSGAISLDYDKPAAKQVVRNNGLSTSDYFVARPGQFHSASELPLSFPLFVKPPSTGGGKGIDANSVVRNFAAFQRKIQTIAEAFQTDALVESYLPGREFSVGIVGQVESNRLTAMPIELVTEQNMFGDRILGHKIKAADTEHVIAITNQSLRQSITALALAVFKALGATDYGRIDIRLDETGIPHFLEANLVPGLADHDFISYFTSACRLNQQMSYEAMILRIVNLGLAHKPTTKEVDYIEDNRLPIFTLALES